MEQRKMEIKPQLAHPTDARKLEKYIGEEYGWEQKLDGTRLMINVNDGDVTGYKRDGGLTRVSSSIEQAFASLPGNWVFDGELLGGVFYTFDLPVGLTVISVESPYEERRAALETIIEKVAPYTDKIELVKTNRTKPDKVELFEWCQRNDAEGIMVKDMCSPYYSGKRSSRTLKAKFWESVDCIVTEVGREGKRSVAVELPDWPNLGSVTVTEKMLTRLRKGDVIEVKYLYCGSNGRLYQPSFLRIRDDKSPEECVSSQLKHVNKVVRTY